MSSEVSVVVERVDDQVLEKLIGLAMSSRRINIYLNGIPSEIIKALRSVITSNTSRSIRLYCSIPEDPPGEVIRFPPVSRQGERCEA